MIYTIDSETLHFLCTALNEKPRHPLLHQAERHFQRWFKTGWVTSYDIEDILDLLDTRLSTGRLQILDFSKSFGFNWEIVYNRPNARSNSVSGSERIRVEGAAAFLIFLERLGFNIDPSNLVKLLLPGIKSKKKEMLTSDELELFWFDKYRHKQTSVQLITEAHQGCQEQRINLKTSTGYILSGEVNDQGEPTGIVIKAPKFRHLSDPVFAICKTCGVHWLKGDPDSSAEHRKEHKRRMAYLDPQPVPKFLDEIEGNADAELVTCLSPAWKHKEIYERALAFKREMNFDFIQWGSPEYDCDPKVHGFLFTNEQVKIVGACAFRFRGFWVLDWVWICPQERRMGHLAARWQAFRTRFGDFLVTAPVSEAMKKFLKKQGDLKLMDYLDSPSPV
jgi:hypothetical protein